MSKSAWEAFDLTRLVEKCKARGTPYFEFLRVPQLSCGIYALAAGARDTQSTHDEEEVYVVLKGRAELVVERAVATDFGWMLSATLRVQ